MALPNVYTEAESRMLEKWNQEIDDLVGWLKEAPSVGKPYPFINRVASKELMRNYAISNDSYNPLWLDENYAKYTRWGDIIAHPFFTMTVTYSPPWPAMEVPEGIGYKFGKVWWEISKFNVPVRAGDTFRVWVMRHKLEDVTNPDGSEPRIFRLTGAVRILNQRDEVVAVQSRTMLVTILPEMPEFNPPKIAPGYAYTAEDIAKIDAMAEAEEIRGAKIRFWEDIVIGEEAVPTVHGPLTAWDSVMGISGVGAPCIPMRVVRKLTPDATFLDPVTNVSHKEIEVHMSDEAARLVSGRPIGVGYEVVMARTVTNWMGDDAFFKSLDWRNYGALEMGTTAFAKAKVIRKYEKDGEHLAELLTWLENIKGQTTAAGVAIVSLMSRKDAELCLEI